MGNYSDPQLGAVGTNGKWGRNTITIAPEGIQMKSLANDGVWRVELCSGKEIQITQTMEKLLAYIFFLPMTESTQVQVIKTILNRLSFGEILDLKERFIELHAPFVRVEYRAERLPYATGNGAVKMVCDDGVVCLVSQEDDRLLYDALILKNKRSVKKKLERMAMVCFDIHPNDHKKIKEGARKIENAYIAMYGVAGNPMHMLFKILYVAVYFGVTPWVIWWLFMSNSLLTFIGLFAMLLYIWGTFHAIVNGSWWNFWVGDTIRKRQIKKLLPDE